MNEDNYTPGYDEDSNMTLLDLRKEKVSDVADVIEAYSRMYKAEVCYLEIDSHYYTNSSDFIIEGTHFVNGINFCELPGVYQLPLNEGYYRVEGNYYGKLMIAMTTSGNNTPYSHPLTRWYSASRTINLGTVQYFQDVCTTSTRRQKRV